MDPFSIHPKSSDPMLFFI